MDDPERPKGFQVRDRRRFTETGEVRDDADAERAEPAAPASPPREPVSVPPEAAEQPRVVGGGVAERGEGAGEITLGTFLMSLSTQALMCLGEIPNPLTGNPEPDLVAVRELIDII